MSLTSAREMLVKARENGYCIAGFDVFNLEMLQAVLTACEHLRSPVMIQTSFLNFDFYHREYLSHTILAVLKKAEIPATLHLDHGARELPFDLLQECLQLGFPSVMMDGSHLPLQENIALMKRVVAAAKPYQAAVEGELGQVSRDPNMSRTEIQKLMTDPSDAATLVNQSGIDYLAVAVGSITGCFDSKKVELDFTRLQEIVRKVCVPLVFHGGTGIPDDQMGQAIGMGVAKVNVAHGLRKILVDTVRQELGPGPAYVDPRPAMAKAMKAMQIYVEKKLTLFGSVGKA